MRRLLAVASVAVTLVACTSTIDTAELEQQITDEMTAQSGVVPASVRCPDEVAAEAGATFECTATADDGSVATIVVTEEDDQGSLRWEVTEVE
jgi:hypothetical protein